MKKLIALIAVMLFLGAVNTAGAFTIDLYETVDNTPSGTHTDTGPVITLPINVNPGFVVLLENTNDNSDQSNWSDVLVFTETAVQLLSDVNEAPNPLWPSYATVLDHGLFILEDGIPTVYTAFSGNVYNVYSGDDPRPVPEPSSVFLLSAGLFGMIARCRKRA